VQRRKLYKVLTPAVERVIALRDTINDRNGNVAGLVNGHSGVISAWYEYGPFGEPIRVSGSMGKANPIRWSTKYMDDTSEFVYY
jgi:hypothetical protein